MTGRDYSALLNITSFPADGYAALADHIAVLLGTKNDVLLMQGEAILSLEAVATSIARKGLHALNIVTSPYGTWFGAWLKRGGVELVELYAEPAKSISIEAVKEAITTAQAPFDLLAVVHAESASGILNPLDEIAALARRHDILTIVDAVASVGGHALNVDASGLDVVVIGPQKALGGPAGVSAISISQKAWRFFEHVDAPRLSILSIIDQKEQWLDEGRGALPGTPAPLEFYALQAALEKLQQETVTSMQERHVLASKLTRRAIEAGGLTLWADETKTSRLVTSFALPSDIDRVLFLQNAQDVTGHTLGAAVGPGTQQLIRINHTGPNANATTLLSNITALSHASDAIGLHFDHRAAKEAIKDGVELFVAK